MDLRYKFATCIYISQWKKFTVKKLNYKAAKKELCTFFFTFILNEDIKLLINPLLGF